ncbi:MAG: PUA domain-containing protein, partial [Candidatus Thorarchaeota archaeon]
MQISPPGDPYPAMEGHLRCAIDTVDEQFGEGVGQKVLPANKTIVINKVSSLDAMFEYVGRIGALSRQKWVSCHDGVLQYLKKGANLMLPGVAGCDNGIQVGDEVWIADSNGAVLGVGIARMSGEEMAHEVKGFAIKIRDVDDPQPPAINPTSASWDDAVRANYEAIDVIEAEAISFIQRTIKRHRLPVVVGFSGGKDSLVTYLLVEKALKESPPLFF